MKVIIENNEIVIKLSIEERFDSEAVYDAFSLASFQDPSNKELDEEAYVKIEEAFIG